MATKLNPLNWDLPIVDSKGRPTAEFARKWKQQTAINGTIPNLSTAAGVSAVEDVLYSTPGGILVRGASLWQGLASPADPTKFLNGGANPAYGFVHDTDLSLADVTGNDVSIARHGFVPKAPNDATKFLNGLGAWAVPSGGGGSSFTLAANFVPAGTASDAKASLGYFVDIPVALKLLGMSMLLRPGASGRTYTLSYAPYSKATNKITSAATVLGTYTSTGTPTYLQAAMALSSPATLAAGSTYAFWMSQTWSTTTTTPDTYFSSTAIASPYLTIPPSQGIFLASNAPTTADLWSVNSAIWGVSLIYSN